MTGYEEFFFPWKTKKIKTRALRFARLNTNKINGREDFVHIFVSLRFIRLAGNVLYI